MSGSTVKKLRKLYRSRNTDNPAAWREMKRAYNNLNTDQKATCLRKIEAM